MLLAAPDPIAGGSGFGPSSSASGLLRLDEPGPDQSTRRVSSVHAKQNLIRRGLGAALANVPACSFRRLRNGQARLRRALASLSGNKGGGFGGRGLEIFGIDPAARSSIISSERFFVRRIDIRDGSIRGRAGRIEAWP